MQLTHILRSIVRDVSRIVQAEIRLARTELAEKARDTGKAVKSLSGAAVIGLFAAACFITASIAALALVMPVWLAALVMGCLLTLISGGAYMAGSHRMKRVDLVPHATEQTLKENIEWAKRRTG